MRNTCYIFEGGIQDMETADIRPDLAYVVEGMYGLRLGNILKTMQYPGTSMTISLPCIFLYKGVHQIARFYQHPTLREIVMEVFPNFSLSCMTQKVCLYVTKNHAQLERHVTENEIRFWDFSKQVNGEKV